MKESWGIRRPGSITENALSSGALTLSILLASVTVLCWLLASATPALADALESSRDQATVAVGRNTITADSNLKYVLFLPGETIAVTLDYSAGCNIVFKDLVRGRPAGRRGAVAGIASVSGTPAPGRATNSGKVTFDLTFPTLEPAPTGAQSGLARLNLQLGVDRDCDLATGDPDGVDGVTTIPVQISVTTDSRDD